MKRENLIHFPIYRFHQPDIQTARTTASADFSLALTCEISPSKVRSLSARSARLYLACLSVTFGFRVP